MTKPIATMDERELVNAIDGYAQSAKRTRERGGDPLQTLSRLRSQLDRYFDLRRTKP
jgi:hypothetical protein